MLLNISERVTELALVATMAGSVNFKHKIAAGSLIRPKKNCRCDAVSVNRQVAMGLPTQFTPRYGHASK